MPLLKHAKKKLRQDKTRTLANKRIKVLYKSLVKAAKEDPTPEALSRASSAIDKAAKNHLMHANKAARMKSSLSKLTPEIVAKLKEEAKATGKGLTKKAMKRKAVANKAAAIAARKK